MGPLLAQVPKLKPQVRRGKALGLASCQRTPTPEKTAHLVLNLSLLSELGQVMLLVTEGKVLPTPRLTATPSKD